MKTYVVKLTQYEWDDEFVYLTTDDNVSLSDISRELDTMDKLLRKEDENGGCIYDNIGCNSSSLMDEVCRYTGWSWRRLYADVSFEIG